MGILLKSTGYALLALCAAGGGLSAAHAQPAPSPGAKAQDPALTRYLEGERHYAAGRYELAVQEFEAAFDLSGKAELHFNIANCHERAGNYTTAAASLEKFLASANPPEPEVLRERIWRLKRRASALQKAMDQAVAKRAEEKRIEERKAEAAKRESEQVLVTPAPETATGGVAVKTEPSYLPAYVTMALGGTALATGLVFAGVSRSAGSDAAVGCEQGFCILSAESALIKERRYARAADITALVGLAAIGAGGYLWYRENRERKTSEVVATPLLGSQIAGLQVTASF